MTMPDAVVFDAIPLLGSQIGVPIPVILSPELVGLLSEQLYRSPSKAIEELIVNGYDAEATEARVSLPTIGSHEEPIVVFDNGTGMTYDGLADLWKVGRRKVRDQLLISRKQIGKFGIGKLASYAVANTVTYVTKTEDTHLAVTIDFRAFVTKPDSTATRVELDVRDITLTELYGHHSFRRAAQAVGLSQDDLQQIDSWTFVILESLKSKAADLTIGMLARILRTTLPLKAGFKIYLNQQEVHSSKDDYNIVVDFEVTDLPQHRLDALHAKTGDKWSAADGSLISKAFPAGISGRTIVTSESLRGKSSDLMRSEGFFVYVRDRLVNLEDARLGLHALSHQTWNRFRSEIHADDLDDVLTANRESMGDTLPYRHAQHLLNEIFNEARQQYDDWLASIKTQGRKEREHTKEWVSDRLVEFPIADALSLYSKDGHGAEADDSWMYLQVDQDSDSVAVARQLYAQGGQGRPYRYRYDGRGKGHRMVAYDPLDGIFTINQDHELVAAYKDDPAALNLLENIVAAETLLEVYLREAGVNPRIIGEVLETRDLLLRGLAEAQMFGLEVLGNFIEESANSEIDLEIAIVAGARALGFVAKHVSGVGEPDGLARFNDFPEGTRKITLEAKSGSGPKSEEALGFSALKIHMGKHGASGCLLVAPAYRGSDDDNTALSARDSGVSCWSVEQFASVVRAVEARQITARQVLDIVHTSFAPGDVSKAVEKLLGDPAWEKKALYAAIVDVLRQMDNVLPATERNVMMIAVKVAERSGFEMVEVANVADAVRELAAASQGALLLREGGVIVLNVDYDELDRRLQEMTGERSTPRRKGAFGVGT